ncbi:Spore Coat Protein U domain protein [Cellvibrio japonicus Ueda107]|uniref:Spore Coat Protein U domain protein n=2 Tax=Cellvibrio japonicus TaxID=155077 RepID=B3PCG7_CELJU|nr:Spore Coat Protein U domain protein [Cellvibrio japonicus Ueda107]QEI11871.1 spore coat protein U domain-containing protein [Cellvibrio japonicus]QEI15445.1 spore coat protein U domain-containing protein [Cellvibrio japonicus]QEI19024.1 spore coat protein U domain-containing protein [Cellvibrio japonicus]
MKYMSYFPRIIFSLLVFSVSISIQAATVNGHLGVTAVVGAGCQVNNSNVQSGVVDFGALNFGSINTLNAQHIDATTTGSGNGSIEMECSDGTSFTISLGNGLHYNNGNRAMVNTGSPGVFLAYALYQDAARTIPWSDSAPLTGTASGAPQAFHVYGRIPGGQSGISAGTYTDTVQVVVSW